MPRAPAKAAGRPAPNGGHKPRWEVADVFRAYGAAYRRAHALPASHRKVMRAVESCRTAALGGHVDRCDACGFERPAYNSCRNRHCPKCQALAKAEWLERRKAELLPVPYFHNVFTLPHELNAVARCNKKTAYALLFRAVSETLLAFAADPRQRLGGKTGFTAVLHTWNQKLQYHLHLHCLLPAGVLSPDGRHWIAAKGKFLFPVKALSKVFRGKFMDYFQHAYRNGELKFPGRLAALQPPRAFAGLTEKLWHKNWVVYSQAPFSGPEKTLDYLGRYTHRVALANHRLVAVGNQTVTFRYRDRKNGGGQHKNLTLPAEEFIRRFLQHVLPKAFRRIRHFGFLANRAKRADLQRCRTLLGLNAEPQPIPKKTTAERLRQLTGTDLTHCPCCKNGRMRRAAELAPSRGGESAPQPESEDSS